ncbi:MAG: thioredoxin family protein [Bdellovibrionota bacterium]
MNRLRRAVGISLLCSGVARADCSKEDLRAKLAQLNPASVVVVEIGAPEWCAPCKRIKKHLPALEEAFKNRATFIEINIDEGPACTKLLEEYGAMADVASGLRGSVPLLVSATAAEHLQGFASLAQGGAPLIKSQYAVGVPAASPASLKAAQGKADPAAFAGVSEFVEEALKSGAPSPEKKAAH